MNTLLLAAIFLTSPMSQVRYPARPEPRAFILDEAKLIKPDEAAEIRILCDEVLTRKKAPIIVLTIPSLAAYGAGGWTIDRYAMNLMSEWGVGYPEWNYGMLLLVSPGDRKARIELGGSWERRKDADAKRVMSDRIVPRFKQGDYSKGILEGVRGLYRVAIGSVPPRPRTESPRPVPAPAESPTPVPPLPESPTPVPPPVESPRYVPDENPGSGGVAWGGCGMIVLIIGGLIFFSFISRLFRRQTVSTWGSGGPYYGRRYGGGYYGGRGGFGSSFGGGLLGGVLGSVLGNEISRRSSSSSSSPSSSFGSSSSSSDSSDFGGGSFGGGFSGGGGATGEW
jgi:uncharacterized membrane protein YgcG